MRKPDYGIDAPAVLGGFFLFGGLALALGLAGPRAVHLGQVRLLLRPTFLGIAALLLIQGCLYLLYVKRGKLRHRDRILGLHAWRGDEQVLDVGCGRGLLLAGAARRLTGTGHATGLDIWSTKDMAGNSEAATRANLALEEVLARTALVSAPAQAMPFTDASFDVVVSNLCLHNIEPAGERSRALAEIARVLRPGGLALVSDFILTGSYARELAALGFAVERHWGNPLQTSFPPMHIVVARKPDFGTIQPPVTSNPQTLGE